MTALKRLVERARRRLSAAGPCGDEAGFTLIEAMVATTMAAMMLLSMAYAMFSGLNAVRSTKLTQQGTHLGSQAVETARELPYDSLTMITSELNPAVDTRIITVCGGLIGTFFFDPDGDGPLACEKIVHAAAPSPDGAVTPYVEPVDVNAATFSVTRYVTFVDRDAQGGDGEHYKRMVALVTWNDRARERSFRATTLVTRAQRGLGTPDFTLSPTDQSDTESRGNQVAFGHAITNHGVDDTYELSAAVPAGRTWLVSFYHDADQNGLFDPSVDTVQLTDADGDGSVNTPEVVTGQTLFFLAVWDLSSIEPLGDDLTTTITAASGSVGTATETATDTLDVIPVGLLLFLHNRPTPPSGNTLLQSNLEMSVNEPTAVDLFQYSSDHSSTSGRIIRRSNANVNTTSSPERWANWNHQFAVDTAITGNATLDFFAGRTPEGGCAGTLEFRVFLRVKNSFNTGTGTTLGDQTIATASCTTVGLTLNFPVDEVIAANQVIEVKILLPNVSSTNASLSYDTEAFPAKLRLQVE